MNLLDFLQARIAEDQRFALNLPARLQPRALRETEAKRTLLDLAYKHAEIIDGEWGCCHDADEIRTGQIEDRPWDDADLVELNQHSLNDCTAAEDARPYLEALALPYAHHPDYPQAIGVVEDVNPHA